MLNIHVLSTYLCTCFPTDNSQPALLNGRDPDKAPKTMTPLKDNKPSPSPRHVPHASNKDKTAINKDQNPSPNLYPQLLPEDKCLPPNKLTPRLLSNKTTYPNKLDAACTTPSRY